MRKCPRFAPLRSCNACNRLTGNIVGARTTLSLCSQAQQASNQASEEKAMANSPSHADAAADGTTEFAFKATFDVMKGRQAKRRSVFAYYRTPCLPHLFVCHESK